MPAFNESNKAVQDTNFNPRGEKSTYSSNVNRGVTPTKSARNLPNLNGLVRGLLGVVGKVGRNF